MEQHHGMLGTALDQEYDMLMSADDSFYGLDEISQLPMPTLAQQGLRYAVTVPPPAPEHFGAQHAGCPCPNHALASSYGREPWSDGHAPDVFWGSVKAGAGVATGVVAVFALASLISRGLS